MDARHEARTARALTLLAQRLAILERRMDTVMSTEADLQTALDSIKSDFAAHVALVTSSFSTLNTSIADLKNQLAAGVPVTQDQLDALVAEAIQVDADIKSAPTS